jgi:hypothetical protein
MKALISVCLFVLCLFVPAALTAQAPAYTRTSAELGFSFSVPADWDLLDTSAVAKEQARQNAASDEDKKGLACADIGIAARHGNPPSVMTETALPFACYGQQMTEAELPGFAASASTGLEQNFDLGEPAYGVYQSGTHRFWIERVKGTVKGQGAVGYTIEIACSVTKKAAVCWMAMAANDSSLAAFEQMPVSLEGDPPAALVPANAFEKKPS